MAIFDEHIGRVRGVLDEFRSRGGRWREFRCPGTAEELVKGLPVRVGPGSNPGIILRSDAFAELGSPEAGSTSMVLWTNDISLVHDGLITLIGPDIPESEGANLSFAQILLVAGRALGPQMHERILENQHVSDRIEGYMVRTSARNIWARVSRGAAAKGFSFEVLGRALMSIMKTNVPEVEAMEIVFVTAGKEPIRRLDEIAAAVQGIGSGIVKEVWKARGYDIECDYNCSSCTHKPVCDEIRDLNTVRKEKERAETP